MATHHQAGCACGCIANQWSICQIQTIIGDRKHKVCCGPRYLGPLQGHWALKGPKWILQLGPLFEGLLWGEKALFALKLYLFRIEWSSVPDANANDPR